MSLARMNVDVAHERLWSRWESLFHARTDWAEKAVGHYLDGFEPEVRDRLAGRGQEATIAIYGPTQVGKTTLILKMLGVSDAAAPRVGNVLRGGRLAGESATATAMRYRINDESDWSWVNGTDLLTSASESQIRDRLADLRTAVESHNRDPHAAPVEVGIPSSLLNADAKPLPIRIIDLPGIQAANEAERAHVRGLAQTYLPSADVIVLLGKADSLEFLKPEVLDLPELLDWWVAPHRFRIVLTHAHLLGTALEYARAHPDKHVPLSDLRTQYLEQLQTHDYPDDIDWALIPRILYPLEYGHSWAALGYDDVRSRVTRANDEAFESLRGSLTALATAEARLAQKSYAYMVAAAVAQRRCRELGTELEELERAARGITEQIGARCEDYRRVGHRRLGIAAQIRECGVVLQKHPAKPSNLEFRKALEKAAVGEPHEFRLCAQRGLDAAMNERLTQWKAWVKPLVKAGALEAREVDRAAAAVRQGIIRRAFDAQQAVVAAWWKRGFPLWWVWEGSAEQAVEVAVGAHDFGTNAIDSEITGSLIPLAIARLSDLESRVTKDSELLDHIQARIVGLDRQLAETQREASDKRARRAELQPQADSAATRKGEFDQVLEAARLQRDLRDLELLGAADNREDRQLLAVNHLLTLRTYDRIRRGSR